MTLAPTPRALADIIFYNGQVVTIEQDLPQAEALAVLGEDILAVGGNEGILALSGPETQEIDLTGKALLPGCRSATVFEWVHDTVHQGGFFAAQGNSGGNAQIAFSLAYYGLDAILDFANLSSGPVPCPISDDEVLNREEQPLCVVGPPGWDGPREAMLSGNPRLHYPNTIVRFFLGENEPSAYVIDTAEAYHRAITSQTSLQVVPIAAHSLHRFKEGHVALLTSMREAASRY